MDADPTGRAVLGRGSVGARLRGLRVGIPPGAWIRLSLSVVCCRRSLCRADHSFGGAPPNVCARDREASVTRRPWTTRGCCAMGGGGVV
jgi:hypothetical protein